MLEISVRFDGGLGWSGSGWSGEKWLYLGFILKVKLLGLLMDWMGIIKERE